MARYFFLSLDTYHMNPLEGDRMTATMIENEGTAVASFSKLINRINIRVLMGTLALFSVFVALFAYVQYGIDALAGNDGYYHIKMGYLIRHEGIKPDFPWLPQTILNEEAYYDHHLLYHVYLALFAVTDPGVDGGLALTQSAKIARAI